MMRAQMVPDHAPSPRIWVMELVSGVVAGKPPVSVTFRPARRKNIPSVVMSEDTPR
jgi:hypothetical protein